LGEGGGGKRLLPNEIREPVRSISFFLITSERRGKGKRGAICDFFYFLCKVEKSTLPDGWGRLSNGGERKKRKAARTADRSAAAFQATEKKKG